MAKRLTPKTVAEERQRRVSKDGPRVPLPPSFETLASQAPQDEDFTYAPLHPAPERDGAKIPIRFARACDIASRA
jgi:hypothetical protein